VSHALQQQGQRVHAITLTGLGERAHLLSPSITLETHIEDIRQLIEAEELSDVVLAVHSYAGMLGTAIADRMGERLKHLVYVDAVVSPRQIRLFSDCMTPTMPGCCAVKRRTPATPTGCLWILTCCVLPQRPALSLTALHLHWQPLSPAGCA
jgi:pimeloyl-ACP methyl ester carboxylesterase